MGDTFTPNLGVRLADPNDLIDFVAHVEAGFSIIDTYMGATKCTSIARPSTTWGGQIVYETDTKRLVENTGTGGAPVWTYLSSNVLVYTSTTRPTLGLQAGFMIYESDSDGLVRWTGSAWKYLTPIVCTSTTRPTTGIAQGTQIYETDTLAYAEYSGSVWRYTTIVTCTSSTRPTTALAAGVEAYETDTHRFITYTGSAWQQTNQVVCTSSTHPASPLAGGQIYETDTTAEAVYNGTAYLYGAQQVGTVILGASAASMSISSIPAFNQLLIVYSGRQDSGSGGAYSSLQLNADSASHYTYQNLVGNVSSATATNAGSLTTSIRTGVVPGSGDTANYFGCGTIVIGNCQSAVFKPVSCAYCGAVSATSGYSGSTGGLWASTAAVTAVKLLPSSGNFVAGSSMTVYGLM